MHARVSVAGKKGLKVAAAACVTNDDRDDVDSNTRETKVGPARTVAHFSPKEHMGGTLMRTGGRTDGIEVCPLPRQTWCW